MAEKASDFTPKSAKWALGLHRGPDGDTLEKSDTISLEAGQKTPMQKVRKHWARFWCCYCFWSVIFLAIFLPIFFLVIIPAIAQNVVDRSTLLLTRADVMQPRPDSVVLTIESALDLPIDLPVRIEPIALELFNRATRDDGGNGTYAVLYIDGKVVDGNTTLGVTDQFTPLNVEEWTKYVHDVVFMEHGPLSVYGQTNSFLGKLKSFVTMDKDIPQNTLNSFSGFAIEDSTLILPPKEDGTNLIANATLPNPSVLTLEIGKTVLDLKSGDLVIGNATIDNLILRPGNHSAPVHGILDLGTLISNLGEVLRTQGDSLTQGFLSLDTVGKTVEYDGVLVPYYTEVMSELVMTAKVPIADLLKNTLSELVHSNGNGNGTGGLLSALNGTLGDAAADPDSGVGNILSSIKKSDGLTSDTVDAFLERHGGLENFNLKKRGAEPTWVDLLEAFV